jgi:hypothetical protein
MERQRCGVVLALLAPFLWEKFGEGLCAIGRAEPLTHLRPGSDLPSLRTPLTMGEGFLLAPPLAPCTPSR